MFVLAALENKSFGERFKVAVSERFSSQNGIHHLVHLMLFKSRLVATKQFHKILVMLPGAKIIIFGLTLLNVLLSPLPNLQLRALIL